MLPWIGHQQVLQRMCAIRSSFIEVCAGRVWECTCCSKGAMPGTKSSAENSMVPSTLKCVCASGSRNSRKVVVKKVLYSSWPTWTMQVSFSHYIQRTPRAVHITGSALAALRQDGLVARGHA